MRDKIPYWMKDNKAKRRKLKMTGEFRCSVKTLRERCRTERDTRLRPFDCVESTGIDHGS